MNRRLILTWALLMGLTVATGFAGGVGGAQHLGALWIAVLAVVTVVKARLIFARYLRLEQAPAFLGGFTSAIVVTVALVAVSFMVITKPIMPPKPGPAATVAPVR
ncbi:MAG: cytochrome C oxidase subunit IV family protein [Siculibacillus sp.]